MPSLRTLSAILVLPFIAAATVTAQQASAPAAEQLEELSALIVTGESAGPALWRVASKDHELWILPVFGPLPQGIRWRSRAVEEVISNSQAVYVGGRAPEGGAVRDPASALRALMNVDGNILRDMLPADLYQKFSDLAWRYAGGPTRYQRYRPYYAVETLREDTMARLRLTSDGDVVNVVRVLAERRLVPVHAIKPVANGARNRIITQLGRTPRTADVPCVRVMLERMEMDLRDSIERANSWTRGDLTALLEDPAFGNAAFYREACGQFWKFLALLQEEDDDARKAMYSTYVSALRRNRSTLALVWVSELVGPDGLAARFRKAGYQVEQPATLSGSVAANP
jgi:hypothetical protein